MVVRVGRHAIFGCSGEALCYSDEIGGTVGAEFNPHQLDYDWRFSSTSLYAISEQIPRCENLLLIGCPSLIPVAEPKASAGLLIERNPYHSGSAKFTTLRADLRYHRPRTNLRNSFDVTVFDAPWYPAEFLRWSSFALSYTKPGGLIFFVLWPEDTRPTAKQEIEKLTQRLDAVGKLRSLGVVSYRIPPFEMASLNRKDNAQNFSREGLLYSLEKASDLPLQAIRFKESETFWRRYRISSHQLALKLNPAHLVARQTTCFDVEPFVLSNTSRRNNEIALINAWASNNVVAKIQNPFFVDRQLTRLQRGLASNFGHAFLEELGLSPDLKNAEWGETWIHRA